MFNSIFYRAITSKKDILLSYINYPYQVIAKQYTYFIILAACLAGPLILSFDKKVAFYRRWPAVFKALPLPALFYIAWDVYFTSKGIWSFNPTYVTGIKIINLPVEEVLFFFAVPFCCLFIYECIRVYFRNLKNKRKDAIILKCMAVLLLAAGIFFHTKHYTSFSFIFFAGFVFILYSNKEFFKLFDATSFIIAWSLILIPFLLVNNLLTSLPVVKYNNNENLGLRIFSIPVEDVIYGMLLVMMNVALYERFRYRNRSRKRRRHSADHSTSANN